MNQEFVIALARDALTTALLISAPVLGLSLAVGILVSIFQAVTQINEITLTFVPKILAVFVALAIFGPWIMNTMLNYTVRLFTSVGTFGP